MLKILDRYIFTRFLFNFFSAFFIIVLIFIFQTIWLYVDELVGKGLSIFVVIKFIGLSIPNLLPIILPLTVVLSSIMTFGAFAENYEFASMKASGVSLLRALRALIIFMVFLSLFAFFSSNYVQPEAHRKARSIYDNIKKKQPALAITEGIFNNVESYSIKVGKKTGENGQYLHDVLIHQNQYNLNKTVIKAQEGELVGENKMTDVLQLILKDGTHYNDVTNAQSKQTNPFTKTHFDTYTLNIDISSMNQNIDFNQTSDETTYSMMNIPELLYTLDSLKERYNSSFVAFGESIYRRSGFGHSAYALIKDTLTSMPEIEQAFTQKSKLTQLYATAIENNKSLISSLKENGREMKFKNKNYALHWITLSDKIALAITCFVLFFVAAPLGAFIRKGGIGMPLVVAMGLFLSYYFLGMLTKNMAKNGVIDPILAPWIPTLILLPVGIYLTLRINSDKPVF